jgi:hypothetical protein
MSLFAWTPPCKERDPLRRDERLSPLVDRNEAREAPAKLVEHAGSCALCGEAVRVLRGQRDVLAAFGDAPGAAPDEAELRRVLFALSSERRRRNPRIVWGFAAAATAALLCASLGTRQWLASRARNTEDAAILAGADAASRRAEHEYSDAISLLRTRLELADHGHVDSSLAQGAKILDAARAQAASLVREHRGDAEREALLREAEHAEVRYYENALLRVGVSPEPAGAL